MNGATSTASRLLGVPTGAGGSLDVDYYVPDFRISIEGEELSPKTHGDVLALKVTLATDESGSFDITLNNWDDEKLAFKYSDSKVLMIGNMVHVELGYVNRLRSVIHGPITGISPRFAESGALTVHISGKDSLEFLKSRKPAEKDRKKFIDMKDTDIARVIATRNDLKFDGDDSKSIVNEAVYQKNLDEAQFLLQRARRIDFDCFVSVDGGRGKGTLHFKRPRDGRDGEKARVYEFEWGRSLTSFAPTLSADKQVSKVTVRGWNARTKEPIVGVATANDLPPANRPSSTSGPKLAQRKFNDRQNLIVDRPVTSKQEARELALSILRERATRFSTGRAQTIGIPDLVPGDKVDLKGLGERFSGEYVVRKVEHSIGSAGFSTSFDVDSPHCGA